MSPYDFGIPQKGEKAVQTEHKGSKSEVKKRVLYGTNIFKNKPVLVQDEILRFYDKNGKTFSMSEELLSKHMLLLGGIGCGKTTVFNMIIEQLRMKMTDDDVMIIFDTKGDFKKRFYYGGSRQYLIGNSEMYEQESCRWNIFDELLMPDGSYKKSVCDVAAKEMAKQLFEGRGSSTQPFFVSAAADLFAKVLIFFMREGDRGSLNNEALVTWLKGAAAEKYIELTEDPKNPDFYSARSYIGTGTSTQALGVLAYINSMVDDLFVGVFAQKAKENEKQKELSMRKFVRNPGGKILFVEYDLSVGEVLGPVYKILFDLALKEALGRQEDGKKRNVYLIIDEYKLLPNLMHIDDGLNFGRSLGVKIFAGLQSISQLSQVYGEDRAKVIAAGFMNQFCFHTWDKESRDFITQHFGKTYEDWEFYDSNEKPINHQKEGNVVEDWDILKLKTGQAYISLIGHEPFYFDFKPF